MAIVRSQLDHRQHLTPEERQMLRDLEKRPIDYSDIPPSTEADWSKAQRGLCWHPEKAKRPTQGTNQERSK